MRHAENMHREFYSRGRIIGDEDDTEEDDEDDTEEDYEHNTEEDHEGEDDDEGDGEELHNVLSTI